MVGRAESGIFEGLPHRKIAALYDAGYDMDALCERYHWASLETLYDAVVYGRGMNRREAGLPPQRPPGRWTTIETEEAVIAVARHKGTIIGAGKAFGVSNDLVRTLFFERGFDYPRKTDADRGASVKRTIEARRVANGFPEITQTSLRADLAGGADLPALAAKYGMSPPTVRSRARELGIAIHPPRMNYAAALRAYEAGESVKAIAERNGKSIDHVRRVLDELGAFKPNRISPPSLPKVKVRGRLAAASLREDLDAALSVREIAERRGVSTGVVRGLMHSRGWKANRRHAAPRAATARAST